MLTCLPRVILYHFCRVEKSPFVTTKWQVFFSAYLCCLDVLMVPNLAAGCCSIWCPNGGHCIVHMHWLGEIVTAFIRGSSCWQHNNSLIKGTLYDSSSTKAWFVSVVTIAVRACRYLLHFCFLI